MPKIIYVSEEVAVIECEYVPAAGKDEVEAASRVEATICIKCGFRRDAGLRNQTLWARTNGQKQFKLLCMNPKSPYLEPMKKQLRETGKIKLD